MGPGKQDTAAGRRGEGPMASVLGRSHGCTGDPSGLSGAAGARAVPDQPHFRGGRVTCGASAGGVRPAQLKPEPLHALCPDVCPVLSEVHLLGEALPPGVVESAENCGVLGGGPIEGEPHRQGRAVAPQHGLDAVLVAGAGPVGNHRAGPGLDLPGLARPEGEAPAPEVRPRAVEVQHGGVVPPAEVGPVGIMVPSNRGAWAPLDE
mmetsp:Transcript_27754/g.65948  ORF Transcript_27754/g.65948 Transcript_27754/m.65948 type:complete len:206 (+) Transcript_27754:578-1195(+)